MFGDFFIGKLCIFVHCFSSLWYLCALVLFNLVSSCISSVQFGIFVHYFSSISYLCALFQFGLVSLYVFLLFTVLQLRCSDTFFISKASLIAIYVSCARYREKVCENDELRRMKGGGGSEEGKQLKILVFGLQFLFHFHTHCSFTLLHSSFLPHIVPFLVAQKMKSRNKNEMVIKQALSDFWCSFSTWCSASMSTM